MTTEEQLQTTMEIVFAQLDQAISSVQALQAGQQMQFQISTNTDWTKLYLQAIYRFIMTPNSTLRYQGLTYRGMRLTLQELKRYTDAEFICNKAITSTSKSRHIAQNFIDCEPRLENMRDVMFIYRVESFISLLAIDVYKFSLSPIEEEVLIMPGILFNVGNIEHTSPYSVDIEMRSIFQDLANGGFAKALTQLFSGLELD